MSYVGNRKDLSWIDLPDELKPGKDFKVDLNQRPVEMPSLPVGKFLFAGIEQDLGENIFLCVSLEDMQVMYESANLQERQIVWYAGDLPESSETLSWISMTGKFSPHEMHLLEVYNTVALKQMMFQHLPIEAMRALAELLLHEDWQRLDELLADAKLTVHWKDWAFGGNGYEPKDCEYVVLLDRRQPAV